MVEGEGGRQSFHNWRRDAVLIVEGERKFFQIMLEGGKVRRDGQRPFRAVIDGIEGVQLHGLLVDAQGRFMENRHDGFRPLELDDDGIAVPRLACLRGDERGG